VLTEILNLHDKLTGTAGEFSCHAMDLRGFEPRSGEVLIRLSFTIDSNFRPSLTISQRQFKFFGESDKGCIAGSAGRSNVSISPTPEIRDLPGVVPDASELAYRINDFEIIGYPGLTILGTKTFFAGLLFFCCGHKSPLLEGYLMTITASNNVSHSGGILPHG